MNKQAVLTEVAKDLRDLAMKMDVGSGWAGSKEIHTMIVTIADARARLSYLEYTLMQQEQKKVKP